MYNKIEITNVKNENKNNYFVDIMHADYKERDLDAKLGKKFH